MGCWIQAAMMTKGNSYTVVSVVGLSSAQLFPSVFLPLLLRRIVNIRQKFNMSGSRYRLSIPSDVLCHATDLSWPGVGRWARRRNRLPWLYLKTV